MTLCRASYRQINFLYIFLYPIKAKLLVWLKKKYWPSHTPSMQYWTGMMELLRDRHADRPTDRQIDQQIYSPCYGFALVDLKEHQKQYKNQ